MNTIIIISVLILLILLCYLMGNYKETFNMNFFPTQKGTRRIPFLEENIKKANNILKTDTQIVFEFDQDTSREQMVAFIGNFFKNKNDNVLNIHVAYENNNVACEKSFGNEKNLDLNKVWLTFGEVNNEQYIQNKATGITRPSLNQYYKIPLEFMDNQMVKIEIKAIQTPMPIKYFLHYYFDPFYKEGTHELDLLNVTGTETKLPMYQYLVEAGKFRDCFWGTDGKASRAKMCPEYNEKELKAEPIAVEPDSNTRIRHYKTPAQLLSNCNIRDIYLKKWDGRGVPIETEQLDVLMKEYVPHPALFQNKLDGLYDDMFDVSRLIPSFPSGKASSGR